ncbi:amidohydrolase family protein [Cnuibacter sp. UC19_7]|uniref:amidohydrolase family protein n=1 Tax=Cnuibacter sp. UC19_7 TaxID=3350166 RepID=UPI00366D03F3
MIIDAHLHVWDLGRARYPWLTEGAGILYRDHAIEEILPTLAALGIGGAVLVQASDEAADTGLMLDVARRHPEVVGVVGWVPLDRPDLVPAALDRLTAESLIVGIRALVHELPPHWLAGAAQGESLSMLETAGLTLDFPTKDHLALDELVAIGERHPELRLVVDHLGKPPIGRGERERAEWRDLLAAVAENPRASAKLSGLYSSVGGPDAWTVDSLRPFVDDALELFGPGRLMYGGDWPVARIAGGYERMWDALTALLSPLDPGDRDLVLGGSAERIYRLP